METLLPIHIKHHLKRFYSFLQKNLWWPFFLYKNLKIPFIPTNLFISLVISSFLFSLFTFLFFFHFTVYWSYKIQYNSVFIDFYQIIVIFIILLVCCRWIILEENNADIQRRVMLLILIRCFSSDKFFSCFYGLSVAHIKNKSAIPWGVGSHPLNPKVTTHVLTIYFILM